VLHVTVRRGVFSERGGAQPTVKEASQNGPGETDQCSNQTNDTDNKTNNNMPDRLRAAGCTESGARVSTGTQDVTRRGLGGSSRQRYAFGPRPGRALALLVSNVDVNVNEVEDELGLGMDVAVLPVRSASVGISGLRE
jgi:hypothetical protein